MVGYHNGMRRRLPFEPEHLIEQLTSWIEWTYAASRRRLVLTSAPTSLPSGLERWMPNAVWRLAWQGNGAAVLYGLAPGDSPTKFFVIRHDAGGSNKEGLFERVGNGRWQLLDGDELKPGPVSRRSRDARAAPRSRSDARAVAPRRHRAASGRRFRA
jgi:hypothetical protein